MLKKINGCLREVSKVFQGSFKGFSVKIKGVSRRPFRVNQGSRKCQVCFKKIQKKFQGYFKNVSIKF